MKKICYCTTVSSTISVFILESVKFLHKQTNWDFSFICSYDKEFELSLPDFIHYYPVNMKRGLSLDGVKVIHELTNIFKREKFDLVQYSTPNASLYASIAAKKACIPVRLYCQWGMVYTAFSGIKRNVFKQEEKYVCNNSSWIEPDSKSNLSFALNEKLYLPNKCSVIWNGSASGVDLSKFDIGNKTTFRNFIRRKYDIPDDAFVYVFVGRVNRDKGINELLRAYRRLMAQNPSYLFIVGDNEVDKTVDSELYEWSTLSKNIIYTGNTDIVEQYLAASDCYVLPSYREGFGMSVIEAQAMGLPVIVTDIPGPRDSVVNNLTGLMIHKKNENELFEAMARIYIDEELRYKLTENGYHSAKNNFDQHIFFEKLLEDRQRLLR